jgi:Flp pilus assembly protein TadB
MRIRRGPAPTVITEASESPRAQLRRREITYVVMMGVRALCLAGATLVVGLRVPNALAWAALFIVGMVLLPWMAVLIANDRPPKKASRFTTRLHRQAPKALPPGR